MSVWAVTMMIGTMLLARSARHTSKPDMSGQAQVEQHEIGLALGERVQPGAPVGRLVDLVALVLERHAQRQADRVVVLDEQQGVHSARSLL